MLLTDVLKKWKSKTSHGCTSQCFELVKGNTRRIELHDLLTSYISDFKVTLLSCVIFWLNKQGGCNLFNQHFFGSLHVSKAFINVQPSSSMTHCEDEQIPCVTAPPVMNS